MEMETQETNVSRESKGKHLRVIAFLAVIILLIAIVSVKFLRHGSDANQARSENAEKVVESVIADKVLSQEEKQSFVFQSTEIPNTPIEGASIEDEVLENIQSLALRSKLIRDVSLAMDLRQSEHVFGEIAYFSQSHMNVWRALLFRYQGSDPYASNSDGTFSDEAMQKTYNETIEAGDRSAVGDLEALIGLEKENLAGIENLLNTSDKDEVKKVAKNLAQDTKNYIQLLENVLARLK